MSKTTVSLKIYRAQLIQRSMKARANNLNRFIHNESSRYNWEKREQEQLIPEPMVEELKKIERKQRRLANKIQDAINNTNIDITL